MSEAMQMIVDGYVKLSGRKALEDLKEVRPHVAPRLPHAEQTNRGSISESRTSSGHSDNPAPPLGLGAISDGAGAKDRPARIASSASQM
jgi:hypothetical protein